ncbi:glycosyltransferase family 2 protein [Paenibacillus gansuensis]|uniref:Glycosyltransferase family 2 protein n=1 Tax=Paenibacillus gansuensis TaxID=306542 RepID=A0ABW5PAZ3_9BACL
MSKKLKNKFKVSIIIPSYNRFPLNRNTLYALARQKFPMQDMEVIFIDDTSTDLTSLLQHRRYPFAFRYIRNKRKAGVAASRNIGIRAARGEVVLFLDAEMVVGPNYVRIHYARHRRSNKDLVVLGVNRAKLYTHLFRGFYSNQVQEIVKLSRRSPSKWNGLYSKLRGDVSRSSLQAYLKGLRKPVRLIGKLGLQDISRLHACSTPKNRDINLARYVRRHPDSRLAWQLCLGSNHSVKRSLLERTGGYDEKFQGWGLEDNEFAYRLYKAGAVFTVDTRLYRFHQEHPIAADKRSHWRENKRLFKDKHPGIDLYSVTMHKIDAGDFAFIDHVLAEYHSLEKQNPGNYKAFRTAILQLLGQTEQLRSARRPIQGLLKCTGIRRDRKRKRLIYSQRKTLAANGGYGHLIRLFDMLAKR